MTHARLESFLLFAVAFAVRAAFPDACIFTTDQHGTLLNGHAVIAGDWFVPGPGIGWSPFKLGPLYNQVAAIAFLLRDEFADLVVLVAGLHAVSVLGFRTIIGRLVDARVARLAAWALALHPESITVGSSPISSSLVLPTTVLFLAGIVWWIEAKEPRGFALASIGAALMLQAHITTILLVPLFLLGFRTRAPIGRVGLAGLLAAAMVASPMIVQNLPAFARATNAMGHAGTQGAPFLVALGRALTLEAHMVTFLDLPDRLAGLSLALAYGFAGIALLGVYVTLRSARARGLLALGLVLPTLVVTAIPRGSLFYYLDSTVPYRAWAFAAGMGAIASWLAARPSVRAAVSGLAVLALAVPASLIVQGRADTAARGYSAVAMARADLRQLPTSQVAVIGVPTLRTQRALADAFDRLGARRDTFASRLHGPWRWMIAASTVAWLPPESRQAPSAHSFLLLHDTEHPPVPGGAPLAAGRFRIHVFDDRFVARPASPGEGALTGDGPALVQLVVQPGEVARLRGDDGARPLATIQSPAGFAVASARFDRSGPVAFDVAPDPAGSPLVRTEPDVYAFSAFSAFSPADH